jgi:hypothetical protein|eukprot:2159211-Prymnesium_polylepis.2
MQLARLRASTAAVAAAAAAAILGRGSSSTHSEGAVETGRAENRGNGWSEVFINASKAGATVTTADAVAQGHSLLLLHAIASKTECELLRSEASGFASEQRVAESSEGSLYRGVSLQGFEEVPSPQIFSPVIRLPIVEMLGLAGQSLCDKARTEQLEPSATAQKADSWIPCGAAIGSRTGRLALAPCHAASTALW